VWGIDAIIFLWVKKQMSFCSPKQNYEQF